MDYFFIEQLIIYIISHLDKIEQFPHDTSREMHLLYLIIWIFIIIINSQNKQFIQLIN